MILTEKKKKSKNMLRYILVESQCYHLSFSFLLFGKHRTCKLGRCVTSYSLLRTVYNEAQPLPEIPTNADVMKDL